MVKMNIATSKAIASIALCAAGAVLGWVSDGGVGMVVIAIGLLFIWG